MFNRNSITQLGGGYGLGFHWTTWNVNKEGKSIPFEEQVNNFNVDKFVKQAKDLGAKHILFTSCHQLQYVPCPNPYIDALIPNRTCKRDLIGELTESLQKENIKFICYYHHGCDGEHQDPIWWKACGAGDFYSNTFYKNIINIISYIGQRYGDKIDAFWFDAGYGLWRRGFVPWKDLSNAGRVGNPNRLITYNPGVRNFGSYTEFQDYYAGETNYQLFDYVPVGKKTITDLDWYAFASLHKWVVDPNVKECAQWGIDKTCYNRKWDEPNPKEMADFVKAYNSIGSTVTFNMMCYNDGSIIEEDINAINNMKKYL